jgi:uncharacterized protein (DUF4415 family)
MKSRALPAGFPANPEEWQRLIDAAPDRVVDPECPYDPNDPRAVEAYWKDAVQVDGGGPAAVREALAQRAAARPPVDDPSYNTVVLDPDLVPAFKRYGAGWQARVNSVLREWLKAHPAA